MLRAINPSRVGALDPRLRYNPPVPAGGSNPPDPSTRTGHTVPCTLSEAGHRACGDGLADRRSLPETESDLMRGPGLRCPRSPLPAGGGCR